jgi:hypothetical protein
MQVILVKTIKKIKMKKIILLLLITISVKSFSQSFNGVEISGNISAAVEKFKIKGFKLSKKEDNVYIMSGELFNEQVELFLFATPITRQYAKCVVYFPESSWFSLKRDYNKFVNLFDEKYGTHTSQYEFFSEPYFEGDGYELSALMLEKCIYITYWVQSRASMAVEISKYKQIKLIYENNAIMNLLQEERQKQQSRIF